MYEENERLRDALDTANVEHSREVGRLLRAIEVLQGELEDAHLARIEAQNPGIDIDTVRRERASQ